MKICCGSLTPRRRLSTARESRKFSSLPPHPRVARPRQSTQARNPPGQSTARRNTDRFDELEVFRAVELASPPASIAALKRRRRGACVHRTLRRTGIAAVCLVIANQLPTYVCARHVASELTTCVLVLRRRCKCRSQASQCPKKLNQRRKFMTAAGDSLSVARDIVCREPETSLPPRMMCMVIPRARSRFEYVIVWVGGS